jgi:hypothetical protein
MKEKEKEVSEGGTAPSEENCPVCILVKSMQERRTRYGAFFEHFFNAQIEMLKAFRSLVDNRIAAIERLKAPPAQEKRATRIDVE